MGRRSKATLSRVNNLGHAQKNLRAQVEDITDLQDPDFDENSPQNHANDLLEEGFFMLEEDLGSDSEDEIEDEELEDESIDKPVTDADIVAFTQILAEAQLAAVLIFNLPRYANRSARLIDAYAQGVSGPIAAWANRKYHGHRILPPEILTQLKNEFHKKYGHD